MQGFITEAQLGQADAVFPGIERYFASLAQKPRTFLELVADFDRWTETRRDSDTSTIRARGVDPGDGRSSSRQNPRKTSCSM
jgi:hypothetical protein